VEARYSRQEAGLDLQTVESNYMVVLQNERSRVRGLEMAQSAA